MSTDGPDQLTGTPGDDILVGLACNDTIGSISGDDTIHGNQDNDAIDAGDGDNLSFGMIGDDVIVSARGRGTIYEMKATIRCREAQAQTAMYLFPRMEPIWC